MNWETVFDLPASPHRSHRQCCKYRTGKRAQIGKVKQDLGPSRNFRQDLIGSIAIRFRFRLMVQLRRRRASDDGSRLEHGLVVVVVVATETRRPSSHAGRLPVRISVRPLCSIFSRRWSVRSIDSVQLWLLHLSDRRVSRRTIQSARLSTTHTHTFLPRITIVQTPALLTRWLLQRLTTCGGRSVWLLGLRDTRGREREREIVGLLPIRR